MNRYTRFAVYYAPEPGPFADAAAEWLGWDPAKGVVVPHPDLGLDLRILTAAPRKYGFHGTLKPPFRLSEGADPATLRSALADLAHSLRPIRMRELHLLSLDGFLALCPTGDVSPLSELAAIVVEALEPFRAPLTEDEVARRRPQLLSPRQRALLDRFGYPFVMEEFRFHLTLSGPLSDTQHAALRPLAEAHFAPHLPQPFDLTDLCLFGEGDDGYFHLLHRYPLA